MVASVRRWAAVLTPLVLLVGATSACSKDDVPAAAPSSSQVQVTTGIRYADAPPAELPWSDPVVDVYAPPEADGATLVVLLPPHGMTTTDPALIQLATTLAQRGAVAAVANWSQTDDPDEVFTDPATLRRIVRLGQSVAGCAIAYAVARSGDFGADPERLVVVGELYGSSTASMVALRPPEPYPGCTSTSSWAATGLVAWDQDWLVTYPVFDSVGGTAVEVLSPWAVLTQAPKIPVTLVVSDAAMSLPPTCGGRDAPWLTSRDPTGAIRARLDRAGVLADGCVDFAEAAEAMVLAMTEAGLPAQVVPLTNADGASRADAGAHFESIGAADLAVLVTAIEALAR